MEEGASLVPVLFGQYCMPKNIMVIVANCKSLYRTISTPAEVILDPVNVLYLYLSFLLFSSHVALGV